MRRIVFFSKEDLAHHSMMNKINDFFKAKKYEQEFDTFNDIIELNHIGQYLDNEFVHNDWNPHEIEYYRAIAKNFKRSISLFFHQLTSTKILANFDDIDYDYTKTFWLLINRFDSYKTISKRDLQELLTKQKFNIRHVLFCNKIVSLFDEEIKDFLCKNVTHAEIILDYYEKKHDREQQTKYFPKSLSLKDKENLIERYVESEGSNLNYLRLIVKSKDSDSLKIGDKVKLKAKKLADQINDELLHSENAIVIKKGVALSEDQKEVKKIIVRDDQEIISYSKKRLLENTDPKTLVLNFRKIFGFFDFQGCIDLVSRSHEIDSFETTFMRSKNEFLASWAFGSKSTDGRMNFEIYKYFLDSINVKLEDIFEFFANDYLNKAFNIDYLKLHLPSSDSTVLEKIRLIVPEFESLLEQYKLYVEDDTVDYDLMQVSTKTSGFEKIPSLLEKKYVYPIGNEHDVLRYNFFNNMSPLFDYGRFGKTYSNFYNLILSKKIKIDEYVGYKRTYIQYFIDKKYLMTDEEGHLSLVNTDLLLLVGYFHKYDVISYWYLPKNLRSEIDKMKDENMVRFTDKLFTEAEQDYFNYYLNNKFSNGLWLRNKYVHATNSHEIEEQENDYKILLKLLVLLILKIEDDLMIAKSILVSHRKSKEQL
ncbi:hypothetical protein H0S70_07925 [Chryseobacterium manosquense]|uniref:Uncharacterized protein n=1 Tax=Chryseobacterium manosquense TaxID=2754694 RepID=A0A7H1DTL2_9FLAO|nr:hypothetical protein [Chryseobacterium manosquense]QNS40320.1 hypothetical protein H0S70_07925 [Chryseobacterium manosquense]